MSAKISDDGIGNIEVLGRAESNGSGFKLITLVVSDITRFPVYLLKNETVEF